MPAYFGNRRGLRDGIGGGTFLTIFGTDLVAWYDASDTASITEVAGAVSQWNDKSGGGAHVTQGTGANQPTYSATGLGGVQPSLSFDSGDWLSTTAAAVAPTAVSNFACFVVGRMNAATTDNNGRCVVYVSNGQSNDHSNAGSVMLIARNATGQSIEAHRNTGDRGNRAVTYDTTFRAASVWNGGSHTMYVENVAGTPVVDANGALGATGRILVGAAYDLGAVTTTAAWGGHICEIAFVKVAPSPAQLTRVQAMLAAKWTV
jgi:hypothetical protein